MFLLCTKWYIKNKIEKRMLIGHFNYNGMIITYFSEDKVMIFRKYISQEYVLLFLESFFG